MPEPITAHPLCWPVGWHRTAPGDRKRATFATKKESTFAGYRGQRAITFIEASKRIIVEVRAFGVKPDSIIISTNLRVRKDGGLIGEQREPEDPGAAVYWQRNPREGQRCMAIDQYNRIADNLAAIAATISAMRAIERHGGAEILERAFTGFAALPAPAGYTTTPTWWGILEVDQSASVDDIKAAFREKAKLAHPDLGGSAEQFVIIKAAYEEGLRQR